MGRQKPRAPIDVLLLLFLGAFAAEVGIILLGFLIKDLVIEISFLFLTVMTAVAMILFLFEGLALYRKLNPKRPE